MENSINKNDKNIKNDKNNKNNKNDKNELINEDDNEYPEMGEYLKDNFVLEDFLKFNKTNEILERNNRWEYENKMDDVIERFYKGEVDYNKTDISSLFANEINYKNLGIFQAMLYKNLKPKYDLEIFYLNPEYAKEMVESLEERLKEEENNRLQSIRNNYLSQNNSNNEFNWVNKTYK